MFFAELRLKRDKHFYLKGPSMASSFSQFFGAACVVAAFGAVSVTQVDAADVIFPAPAPVAEIPTAGPFLNEVRLGVMYHDPSGPEESVDINGEVLFDVGWNFALFGAPAYLRPAIGGTVNTEGYTSQAYAQLALTVDVTEHIFIEGTFGGMVHNGEDNSVTNEDLDLGCSPLFRESATIGFRVTERVNVMATVSHASNAGLCDKNDGLTNYGARVGYSF
ncbi:MAG: acyloxyacyl hydrolase [Hyphomicrobiales bacterium]|nr:acyloxyacyl hydrolase [Hyphomicrobiales bacterium]